MYTLYPDSAFTIAEPRDTYIYELAPIGSGVASISSDNILRVHDPLALDRPLSSFELGGEVTALKALDAEGGVVCTAGRDGKVGIWDLRAGSKVGEIVVGKF
jgi:WD40 repeat protein